jgi:hypothetical protein
MWGVMWVMWKRGGDVPDDMSRCRYTRMMIIFWLLRLSLKLMSRIQEKEIVAVFSYQYLRILLEVENTYGCSDELEKVKRMLQDNLSTLDEWHL